MKKPSRDDWQTYVGRRRIAQRFLREFTEGLSTRGASALAKVLDSAYSVGYDDANKWQMDMRIRDATECHEKNGRHL